MKYFIIVPLYIILNLSSAFSQKQQLFINNKDIDKYISSTLEEWEVPGCAIAITKADKLLYSNGYGYRDVENKLPVTPNTVFKIASCTKSFTAAATGLLVNQNILDWNEPVKKYLPELEFSTTELTNSTTLRDLLNHRTGIIDDDWSWVGDHIDAKRMLEILSAMPQGQSFRSGYYYNNMAYALAGYLSTVKTNSSWRDLIRKFFFEPLSMTSSLFSHNELSEIDNFSYGYEWNDSLKTFIRGNLSEHLTDSLSVCEPFAFISSSANDLAKWLQMFLNKGNFGGKQIIPKVIFKELVKPVNYMYAPKYPELAEGHYCMGWEKNYYKRYPLMQHSGGLTGFKSYMSYMPEDSIGIVVLCNGQPYRFAEAVSYDLYDMILGLTRTAWSDRFLAEQKNNKQEKEKPETEINGTHPSLDLSAYAGVYFSKLLGTMKVVNENGELYFIFHSYPKEIMKHAHYDTFISESGRITFRLNHDGEITGMLLNEYGFDRIQ